jgi:ribosomal protein S18 acetylase RimI-like enzyme
MVPRDFPSLPAIWAATEGMGDSPGDSPEDLGRLLARNPGLCFVAVDAADAAGGAGGETIVGTILAGQDGRRGYLYRLAVLPKYRRQGLAAELVQRSLAGIEATGIVRCLALVQEDNPGGRVFWESMRGKLRTELVVYTVDLQDTGHP